MSTRDLLDDATLREIIIDVARMRSMSAAARLHSLSQPTVRSYVDRAEQAAGCRLFRMTTRGTTPTSNVCHLIREWQGAV